MMESNKYMNRHANLVQKDETGSQSTYFLWSLKIGMLSILLLLLSTDVNAQEERTLTRAGNKEYKSQKYQESELSYRKALVENPAYPEGQFNLGDAIYQQNRYEEAIQPFEQILAQTESEEMKAWTHHNMGNAQLESKKFEEAILSYKNALRINPSDLDTKYNLAYAQQMLQEKEQNGEGENEEQENENEENEDQQQNEEQQDQENKEQEKQDGGENEDEKKDGEQEQQQNEQQKEEEGKENQQPKPNQLSKEEAERILQALENEERKVQAKVQKEKGKPSKGYIEKDW